MQDAISSLLSSADIQSSLLTDNVPNANLVAPQQQRRASRRNQNVGNLPLVVDETLQAVQSAFRDFLNDYRYEDIEGFYISKIEEMVGNDGTTLLVDFDHIAEFWQELADGLEHEFYRYEPCIKIALQEVVKAHFPNNAQLDENGRNKEFFVSIYNYRTISKIREIRAHQIGQLIAISGTVTRTSEVRPELILGTFSCHICGELARDIPQQFKYTEPSVCPNARCDNSKQWDLVLHLSKFVDWQKIRVQENSDEIPAGSMPRTIQVIVRNELVEEAKPGDKCVFTGSAIVIPDVAALSKGTSTQTVRSMKSRARSDFEGVTGLSGMGVRELTYKISFLACGVLQKHSQAGDISIREEEGLQGAQLTDEQINEIITMSKEPRLYTRLASSIAPNIFGHDEIKRGILLMLFGGVHKKTTDAGMGLRGDINICVVGDPSTAKSQFLKYVVGFLPRAIYTSGKASSAAGLTASVARDPETGEFGIEAGALLLADNGICCIDEFDKMDPKDQVAIHEAMEQQTISITKAGITATLNARASILAAANPIYGRYDQAKTLRQNVSLSPPIMSRFDLFFVVLDECDPVLDYSIARKIVGIHQDIDQNVQGEFSADMIQKYISYARSIKPKISPESMKVLASHYCRLRERDMSGASKSSYRITVRQLESMIRLSEALARLHLCDIVYPRFVNEAFRLIKQSVVRVRSEDVVLEGVDDDLHDFMDVDRSEDIRDEGTVQDGGLSTAEKESGKLTISFDQYKKIANMLVMHLQRESVSHKKSFSRTSLKNWYLEQKHLEAELGSQLDMVYHTKLVSKIIKRLIEQDGVLIEVSHDNIIVHPNYDIENE